jgi:hypothetical protein
MPLLFSVVREVRAVHADPTCALSSPLKRVFPRNSLNRREIYFLRNCPKHPTGVAILKLGARDGNDPRVLG